MSTLAIVAVVAATFFGMEFVAWATHKYVMHGFLWYLHSDHHKKDHYNFLERNDAFFLIFAIPSMILFIVGATLGLHTPYLWIGLGILLYGLAYFFVHEVFIHQRIKWLRTTENPYFLAIRRAHKVHHKRITKEDGECFGMLLVPLKYYRDVLRSRKAGTDPVG
jgi:beta-carotene 3-hydroxylase